MNFRPEIKEINLSETVFSKNTTETVQGDLIVPDVKGDIGKILQTDAVAVIDSKELVGGRATIAGTVYATILYAPVDGGIDSMSTTMGFSHIMKTESDDMYLTALCGIKGVEHSLYNSRKMNVRVNVAISVTGTRDINPGVLVSCESDRPVETCRQTIPAMSGHIHASDVIPFRETLDIPTGQPGVDSVLKCNAKLTDRDFRLLSNKAVIRGNLVITVLYRGDDGSIARAEFTQPMTEITDAPGAEESMKEKIHVSLSPFTATPTANGDGNMRAFFAEGKLYVETECCRVENAEIITDMFCTDCQLNTTMSQIPSTVSEDVVMLASVREIIPSDEIQAKKIYSTIIRANAEKAEVADGTITVTGKADADLMCQTTDGSYMGYRKLIPFTYSGAWDGDVPTVSAEPKGATAVLSGAGDVEIRFTAAITAQKKSSRNISCITDAAVKENAEPVERPSLVVYFTKPGDTLWNIAKHYGVTRDNIQKANDIGDVVAEGQKIIIPR